MRPTERDAEFIGFVTAQRAMLLRAARLLAVGVLRHWLDLDVQATAQALGCSTGPGLTAAFACAT